MSREIADNSENRTIAKSAGYYLVKATAKVDPALTEAETDRFALRNPHSRRTGELMVDLGHEYRRQGDNRTALSRFKRAVDQPMTRNSRVQLMYRIAETAADDGSRDEARDWFLRAADLQTQPVWAPRALYARGRLSLEEEAYAEACGAFDRLRQRHPDSPMTLRSGTDGCAH